MFTLRVRQQAGLQVGAQRGGGLGVERRRLPVAVALKAHRRQAAADEAGARLPRLLAGVDLLGSPDSFNVTV